MSRKKKNKKIITTSSKRKKSDNIQEEIQKTAQKSKEYWTKETEDAVAEFLKNDFNFYQHKINKHREDVETSIKKNKENKRITIINIDDDFILLNEAMIDYTKRKEVVQKKEEIFRKHIYTPLSRLVENIIFNFKLFIPGESVKTTHNDCMANVIEKFCNFDPEQNTKSFSFYGTISKHYLQNRRKNRYKKTNTNLNFDNYSEEAEEHSKFEIDEESELNSSLSLFNHIIEVFENEIDREGVSKNDAKVAEAIVDIFNNHEIIGTYSKGTIYKLIKEHTNLESKDITYSIHRFKVLYKIKKKEFVEKHKDKYYGKDEGEIYLT